MKTQFNQLLASLVVVASALACRAETASLVAVADTFINSGSATLPASGNNAGGHSWFDAGTDGTGANRRGLIRFDLSSIPSEAVINSAALRLTVARVPQAGPVDSTFSLRRVNTAWGEGVQIGNNGALAVAGESTWIDRIKGTATWNGAGGLGDVSGTTSATANVGVANGALITWSGPGVVADVTAWLGDPAQNFGWLIVSQSEGTLYTVRGFYSSEAGVGLPTLEIDYTAPVVQPTVLITSPTNNAVFTAPATITIEASAQAASAPVTNVAFFDGASLLGNDDTSPYSISVELSAGTHALTASATDNSGATVVSSPVNVTIVNTVITNPIAERIPKGDVTVELQQVAAGMASPVGMAWPNDGTGRLFVADQNGKIWVVSSAGARFSTPLLDVGNRLVLLGAYDERGLLGFAVHPNFAQNQLIYTYTSETNLGGADFQTGLGNANNHQSVIAEWKVSAGNTNIVDLSSRREILRIDEPQANHNGGAMQFGSDGYLYISLGDGGQANDSGPGHVPDGNAQNIDVILGKLLRIDVNGNNSANGKYGIPASNPFVGTNGLDEIYAYGLRNAFSFSFDRGTGDLYLPDVGQNKVEEVNIINPGGNYGWNLREGSFWFDAATGNTVGAPVRPPPAGMTDPIAQYDHDDGFAVIGGYVYRGTLIPELSGRYVFGDWGSFGAPSGRLFYLDANRNVKELRIGLEDRPLGLWLKGFGEGPNGELYVLGNRWLGPSGNTGVMLRIVPAADPITSILSLTEAAATLDWSGGNRTFAVQSRRGFEDLLWNDGTITNQRTATFLRERQAFFRVKDVSNERPIPLTAFLTGSAERPTPNNSPGTGLGLFSLDGNALSFNIQYSGLNGTANNAHIHGPASASGFASVMIDLAPFNGNSWGQSGTLSGVLLLTDVQKALLLSGKTYVNIHSTTVGSGEIRGQIAPVNMQVELSGDRQVPALNVPGRALGNLMLVGNRLTMNLTYKDLSGSATGVHIHGPASATENGNVMVNLAPLAVDGLSASGSLPGSVTLTPDQIAAVVDGLAYINFHTLANGTGEIRGQILPFSSGIPLTAKLSGIAERPPNASPALGSASFSLDGDTLTFNVEYTGLTGPATSAHIHGPVNSSTNANVLINLASYGTFGTSGALSGSVRVTTAQRNFLMAGQTYVNIHTGPFTGGEIRGQIAPVLMTASMAGNNERPAAAATTATGSGTFALIRDQLTMNVVYRDLLSSATASHIHGPAGFTGSGSVLVDLASLNGGAFGISGALSGTVTLNPTNLLHVIDQQTYVNLHTTNYTGGEIRGHIMR